MPEIFARGPNQLACIENEFQRAYNHCTSMHRDPAFLDDCIVSGFFLKSNATSNASEYTGGVTTTWTPVEKQYRIPGARGSFQKEIVSDGTFYLDANCNSVSGPTPQQLAQVCDAGVLQWKESPISLLLDADHDVDTDMRFTQFPLDPSKQNAWYTWKASAKAPLLVYDPEHTGNITSAFQLFGNWTFGGRQYGSLANDAASPGPTAWTNGYEALATLDSDRDGRISNQELAPLALWFDENRDGVSQPGEVRALSTVGITALFYEPNRKDSVTQSVIADRGFERSVGGLVSFGASVDWFGASASSADRLLAKGMAEGELCGTGSAAGGAADPATVDPTPVDQTRADQTPVDQTPAAKESVSSKLNGAWKWRVSSADAVQVGDTRGFFTFKTDANNIVSGHTLVEVAVGESLGIADSMVRVAAIRGTSAQAQSGVVFIRFQSVANPDAAVINEAVLSADGAVLSGTTSMTILKNGRAISMSYGWTAVRVTDG